MLLFLFSILGGRVEVVVRLGDGDADDEGDLLNDDEDVRLIFVVLG